MKTKAIHLFTVIGVLALLMPAVVDAQTENKIVTIADPLDAAKAALYSGTYIYQGTRASYNGSSGGIKTRAYYKCGSNYLYADYMNGRDDFPNGFEWVIRAGSIESRIQTFVYQGWESSEMNYPSSSGPSYDWWWADMSGNEVTVNVSNAVSGVAPSVTTLEASLVTTTSGTMGGNVTADGGATTNRGFVYSSTDATPTIGEPGVTQITKGTGTGVYTEVVSSLTAGVTYYYQAYGYNTYGTTYGTVKSFTTPTTSAPNKIVSNAGGANGIYVWIGEYYGKPAWKHESLNYWLYYSKYGMAYPADHYWFIDDELKDEHGAEDFNYDHLDAATCPSSGWRNPDNSAASVTIADYPQIDFTDGSAFSPGNATANTNYNLIGRFFLDADISGAFLSGVTINVAGTNQGVTNIKLFSSSDASFGGDTQLDSESDGSTITFSGFNSAISTSGTYYFVTTDLAFDASGSFTLTIGSKTDLTFTGGASSTVFSNAALTSGTITISSIPEMNVKGNNTSISDGDVTPDAADHTDFGSVVVGSGSIVRTFTIENLGGGTLSLTDASPYVVITGATADFSLTQTPSGGIAGSGSTTFQVTFDPTTAGTRSATISIANDDGDENPYNFSTQGTGVPGVTLTNGANAALDFTQTGPSPLPYNNWPLGEFSLTGDAAGATLNSMAVSLAGTYDPGDLASNPFQLYASNTNDFGSASAIGSSAADPGSGNDVMFGSLSDAIPSGTRYYWVTADISATAASDDKLNGTISDAGDLSITGGTLGASSYGKLNAGTDASLPVELASFSARCEGRSIILEWTTESEVDNLGFILERREENVWIRIASYQTHDALKGRSNTSSRTEYAFADVNVEPGKEYSYRLSDVSSKGKITAYSALFIKMDDLPKLTRMEKAYPNPFNPRTHISYQLSEDGRVEVSVFDLLGRGVKSLYTGHQPAGSYHVYWNGTDESGNRVPSGGYLIQMKTEKTRQIQKVMLMK